MNFPTLRDLSRAYALASLDRETYRRQRHELLTRIAAGELPVLAYTAPEPEQRTVFPDDDSAGDITQEILAPLPARPPRSPARTAGRPVVVAVVAVALAAGGWAARHYFPSQSVVAKPLSALEQPPSAPDPLADFLDANQWQSADLTALDQRWHSLDTTTREQLSKAPSMHRLLDKVLEQIQAQRALLSLGDGRDALTGQQQLLDLMTDLGVHDPRLQRARVAWQLARVEQDHLPATVDDQAAATSATADATGAARAADSSAAAQLTTSPAVERAVASATMPAPPATALPGVPAVAVATTSAPVAPVASTPTPKDNSARNACQAALAKTRRPYCRDTLGVAGKGPTLVVLPAGEFTMGGAAPEEQPLHTVRFEHPFAMAVFEVSGAELARFCSATHNNCPAQPWRDAALPAVNVSWAIATAYTQWLSQVSGANYRLPSEAEWEYAARAGSTTPYPFGTEILPTHARYSFKSPVTTPLAANDRSVNHNEFKLYHMLGNVREWVRDSWQPSYAKASADGRAQTEGDGRHIARGGSYADHGAALRSAARVPLTADGDRFTGLRVLREIE